MKIPFAGNLDIVNVPNNLFDVKITYKVDLFPKKQVVWIGKNLTQNQIQLLLLQKSIPDKQTITHHKRKFKDI